MFEQDFESMLRKCESSLDDKKRFTALVKDLFPDQAKNVNLLLMAYNMGIAQLYVYLLELTIRLRFVM